MTPLLAAGAAKTVLRSMPMPNPAGLLRTVAGAGIVFGANHVINQVSEGMRGPAADGTAGMGLHTVGQVAVTALGAGLIAHAATSMAPGWARSGLMAASAGAMLGAFPGGLPFVSGIPIVGGMLD